jgi:hypothetical protein
MLLFTVNNQVVLRLVSTALSLLNTNRTHDVLEVWLKALCTMIPMLPEKENHKRQYSHKQFVVQFLVPSNQCLKQNFNVPFLINDQPVAPSNKELNCL